MTFSFVRDDEVAKIKSRLDHPVLDTDGHLLEFLPLVLDVVARETGKDVAERLAKLFSTVGRFPSSFGPGVLPAFAMPRARLDDLTVALPELLYKRLDEIGVDFALLYPS